MRFKKTLTALAAGLIMASFTSAASASTTAAATSPQIAATTVATTTTIQTGMVAARVLSAVPVTGGGAKVLLTDGKRLTFDSSEYSAWKSAMKSSKGKLKPNGYAIGGCGYSFVTITALGGNKHQADVQTGFKVKLPAIDYKWAVHFADGYGTSSYHWGGGLLERITWTGELTYTAHGGGKIFAWVNAGEGLAVLTEGSVCYSLAPTASTTVF